jgi:protein-S-isoprenylcysteine O-methyltransferase Ste14
VTNQPFTESTTPGSDDTEPAPVESHADRSIEEQGFLPTGPSRLHGESIFVRLIATLGVVGIGTAVGALLTANDIAGWITGLVVSLLSVLLAAVLWRSRQL